MSTIKVDTIQSRGGGAVTLTSQHAVKTWVNLNGTSTIAMRDSFNMASVTDNGTGDYTYTMTNAMSNANYSSVGAGGRGTTNAQFSRQGPGTQYADVTSSAWTAECGSNTYAVDDWDIVCWAILGDLA